MDAAECFHESDTLCGKVDADEPFTRFVAICGAAVQPNMTFLQYFVAKRIRGVACGGDVHPCQIGSFHLVNLQAWQFFGKEVAERLIISEDIIVDFVNPLVPVVVGGFVCQGRKRIDITDFIDIDGPVDTSAPLCILTDDVCHLQSCNIKRL